MELHQSKPFVRALETAFIAPNVLLIGALMSQHLGGLAPCQMCMWQRYPHMIAIVLAMCAIGTYRRSVISCMFLLAAALSIAASGAIGAFHAGVEQGWWDGLTACASGIGAGGDPLEAIMKAPVIRCDVIAWTFLGISLAGWNAIFSTAIASTIVTLMIQGVRRQRKCVQRSSERREKLHFKSDPEVQNF